MKDQHKCTRIWNRRYLWICFFYHKKFKLHCFMKDFSRFLSKFWGDIFEYSFLSFDKLWKRVRKIVIRSKTNIGECNSKKKCLFWKQHCPFPKKRTKFTLWRWTKNMFEFFYYYSAGDGGNIVGIYHQPNCGKRSVSYNFLGISMYNSSSMTHCLWWTK